MGKYHTNEATELFAQACITMCKTRTMMIDDIAAALRENNKRIVLEDPFYLSGEYDSDICSEIYLDEWGYVVLSCCHNRCLENLDDIQVGYLYTHLKNEGVFGDEDLLERWLYSVEEVDGKKTIHVDGYCYWNGETYQLVQGTFCYISLKDARNEDRIEEAFSEVKQYQREVTEQEVLDYYNVPKLPIYAVTEKTPFGTFC